MSYEIIALYSKSLFNSLKTIDENNALKVFADLEMLEKLVESSDDLRELLYSPAFYEDEKKNVFKELVAQLNISEYATNLYYLLIERRKTPALKEIIVFTRKLYDASLGFIDAELISASKFSEEEITLVKEKMSKIFPEKRIRINSRIDDSLLGGALLKIGNKIYDGSLKGMITDLRETLMENI